MRVRGYQQNDLETMCRLDLECFRGPFQFDRQTMVDAVEEPSAIIVVMEDHAGGMLGFLIAHPLGEGGQRYAYIVTIDVAERARRTGVGAAMMQAAEEQARRNGMGRMGLHVAEENAGAIVFYEQQGYERIGVAKRFYREAGQDAIMYVKQLSLCVPEV